jgi:hypothetical protein
MTDSEKVSRPEHDPVAEDMDIMTHQEAAARFYDAIEQLTAEGERMASSGADEGELREIRERIQNLEAAALRVSAKGSAVPVRGVAGDQ